MEERERQFIPGLGILMLTIILLGAIGSLLHDSNGVGFDWAGGILWGGAVFITFLLGTAYISRRLLPIQDNQGWAEGFHLLWRNYWRGAANLLYGRVSEPGPVISGKRKKSRGDELSPSFEHLRAGFLDSHLAAAIVRGNSYSRAAGPGLVLLHGSETISKLFDLRPHSRKMPVSAITRDGIPIETTVSVTFQVRRPSPDERRPRSMSMEDVPYPYDPDALFDLMYTASVTNDNKLDWTEQACPQAAAMLVTEIAKYTLDQLLEGAGAEPVSQIKRKIKSALQEQQLDTEFQTLSKGMEILSVSIGPVELPDEVIEKRVSTWQVEWQNRVSQELISGDIEAQRLYQQARARAQVENIENLLTSIEAMRRQTGVELHEAVMRQVMEILESLSAVRSLGPANSRAAVGALASEASEGLRLVMGDEDAH